MKANLEQFLWRNTPCIGLRFCKMQYSCVTQGTDSTALTLTLAATGRSGDGVV